MLDLEKVRYLSPHSSSDRSNKYSSSLGPSWQLRLTLKLGWQVGVGARLTDKLMLVFMESLG